MSGDKAVAAIAGTGSRVEMLVHLITRHDRRAVVWPAFEDAVNGKARQRISKRLTQAGAEVVDGPESLAAAARTVFVVAPSWRLRAVASSLGEHLGGHHSVVHTSRGLEADSHLTGSEVIRQETASRLIGALVGPIHAADHLLGKPGAAVVGSRFPSVISAVQAALADPMFRVYGNRDLVGVEVGGAAAGLLAVALGLADGLDLGSSVRGTLFARGVAELERIGSAFGAQAGTLTGMAGLGYLAAVSAPPVGIPVKVGRALAAGKPLEEILERFPQDGRELVTACETVREKTRDKAVDAHITAAIAGVLVDGQPPSDAVRHLLSLGQMME